MNRQILAIGAVFVMGSCSLMLDDGNAPNEGKAIGGTITGLVGSGLVLQVNGADDLAILANATTFQFNQRYALNTTYDVTVLTQPTDPFEVCTVTNGAGIIQNEDVTDISVACVLMAPEAPSGLVATATSSNRVHLTWTDNSSDETGFIIERSNTSESTGFTKVATTGADANSYDDTGVAPSLDYWYRVKAFGSGGDSFYSNVAPTTTPNLTVLPKLQYTVRDIPPDGNPDVFVGADPFLDIKPGTEDRALLQFNIYSVPASLTNADLHLYIRTSDPDGTTGTISVYYWEASGFTNLSDFVTSDKTLIQSFVGPNGNTSNPYVINVTTPVRALRQSGRGFIGFLFVGKGTDRFSITTTDSLNEAEKPHLEIEP